jgi:hypothetical protein
MIRTMGFAIALALTGCGVVDEKDEAPEYTELKDQTEAARAQWQATMPRVFVYELGYGCFCSAGQFRVTVENDAITRVERIVYDPQTKTSAYQEVAADSETNIRSVQELFDLAIELANERPDSLHVVFEPSYHFPVEIHVDHKEGVADDELGVYVRGFTVLEE